MTDDLRARLEEALGSGYRVDRELGGGGMSRVFVAEDLGLGREVVVKVLAPELSAEVSAERFRREMQVAARLQHPHIVPLFSAGQSGDLLYFTMPYVEGQSLRGKLVAAGELPVQDAVGILRNVAAALVYAHEHGVVHRDIKPENILLSGSQAVVTDFGVAKALSLAVPSGTLTSAGVALGTPAYMAPEQAAADPSTDHRADLYSLGVLGYELLTGAPPFSARPAAQMLAAHVTEIPDPVSRRRGSTPPALASLIMRLLEKRPSDRPQSASEVLRELDLALTPREGSAPHVQAARLLPLNRKWLTLAGAAVLLIAAVFTTMKLRQTSSAALNPNTVVVAPFRVVGADPSFAYLREGMLDLLAAKFTGEGGPAASDPRSVMSAWRSAASSADADLSEKDAILVAERLGAGRLVLGGVVGTPKHLVLNASLLEVPSGRAAARASVEGSPDSLPTLVDKLAIQLLAGEKGGEQLALLSSLPALRAFLQGRAAYRRGLYDSAITHFEQALSEDSTFALAGLGLTVAANWAGNDEQRDHGERVAWSERARLSAKDRAYLELFTGPRYPDPAIPLELIDAGARAVRIAPDNPEVWYEYGDALYHLGPVIAFEGAHPRAAEAFGRAVELDSSFAAPREHLIDLAAKYEDTSLVRKLGSAYLRSSSTAGTAEYTRWRVALALGDSAVAREVRASFRRMSPFSLQRVIGFGMLDGFAPGDVALATAALPLATPAGRRGDAFFPLLNAAINFGAPSRARKAITELRPFLSEIDSLGLVLGVDVTHGIEIADASSAAERLGHLLGSGQGREADIWGPLCGLETWRLLHGNTETVKTSIRRVAAIAARASDRRVVANERICVVFLQALTDIAEHNANENASIKRVDSLLKTSPSLGHEGSDGSFDGLNYHLAGWLESKGDYRGALAALRRRIYIWNNTFALFAFLRQEGRVAAIVGDTAGAIRAYRHYLLFRSNPEPELKPQVDSVRAELARLERTGAARR